MPLKKGHKVKGGVNSKAVAAKKAAAKDSSAAKDSGGSKGAAASGSGARQAGATLEELETERQKVLAQLQGVEEQVFKLETAYFQKADRYGNALIGYSGLLDHPPQPKQDRPAPVHDDERLFSGSSVTGFITEQQPPEDS